MQTHMKGRLMVLAVFADQVVDSLPNAGRTTLSPRLVGPAQPDGYTVEIVSVLMSTLMMLVRLRSIVVPS